MDGILLVDKAKGPTSHDVVARVRRAFGTRAVGHAGTLDPMATGLLVLGIGEGTKLLAALTDDDKSYDAEITLGSATDTLDAEGTVVETAEVPPLDAATLAAAIAPFLGTYEQRAPVYSAIKREGRTLHDRARRGEAVEAPVRSVLLRAVSEPVIEGARIRLRVDCGKGFYVRSFARDLAEALGTVGHLSALRRLASGGHRVDDAIALDALVGEGARERGLAKLRSLADGLGVVPAFFPNEAGLREASFGRPIRVDDVPGAAASEAPRLALLTAERKLVALVTREGDVLRITRGFVEGQSTIPRAPREEDAPCER